MQPTAIPEAFIDWAYTQRAALIRRQAEGEPMAPHEIFLDPSVAPQSVAVGDFNKDGTMDLAVASSSYGSYYYYTYGDVQAAVARPASHRDACFQCRPLQLFAGDYADSRADASAVDRYIGEDHQHRVVGQRQASRLGRLAHGCDHRGQHQPRCAFSEHVQHPA